MVSFNDIPSAIRVPWCYVEVDNSAAISGSGVQPYKALLIGQKTSAGTQAAETLVQLSSAAQAQTLFGVGSMLANMAEAWFDANKITELWAIALDDDAAGAFATGKVTFAGTATEDGTIAFYVGGKVVEVGVDTGDDLEAVSAALVAAIQADTSLPISAVVDVTDAEEANLTAKHKGLLGNSIDLRFGYAAETLPAGITATIAAMSGGTTNPDVEDAIAVFGDGQWNAIVMPYTDAGNLTAIETQMSTRFGPLFQTDGHVFTALRGTNSAASTLGNTRNSPHVSILGAVGIPTLPWEVAAAWAAVVANAASIDPARPLQTLTIPGVQAPANDDLLTLAERNVLLFDGISTFTVDSGGLVRIERVITTYKTNGAGAEDESYLDYETLATLSYLRYSYRNRILSKYPRHKIADDGTRFAAGQSVLTPKLFKAEAINLFRQWEELGLVENADAFKEGLIVERNATNPNRMDSYLPPNLINQFRIAASQIAFRL